MALDIGANFKITAGVAGQAQVDQLHRSLQGVQDRAGGLQSAFTALKGTLAGLGVAAFVGGMLNSVRAAIDAADAMNDMAERTGVAGDRLGELAYAAKLNGAELNDVETALKKLSSKATDAATGVKSAAATFDALGVSVLKADGTLKSSDVLFQEIADVLNTVEDRTLRTAMAVEIFGKSGDKLIPLMENMRSATAEARAMNAVIGEDMQKAAAEYNDNVDRMAMQTRTWYMQLANEAIPTLNRFMTELLAGRAIFGSTASALWNIGTTNPFSTAAENAAKYRAEVQRIEAAIKDLQQNGALYDRNMGAGDSERRVKALNVELENTKRLVEYFQRVNGQTSTAGAGRGFVNPAMVGAVDSKGLLDKLRSANAKPERAVTERAVTEKISDYDRLKKSLEDATMRVDQLSEAEKLLREIQLGRFKDLTPAQQQELLQMAKDLDYRRLIAETEKTSEERRLQVQKEREAAAQRAQEEQEKEIKHWEDLAAPAKKYQREIEKIREAFMKGLISDVDAKGAIDHLEGLITKLTEVKDTGKDAFEELRKAIEKWGNEAADAFVEFAFGAKNAFRDLVTSILKDLARMMVKKNVTDPLFKWISDKLPSFFGFADGGIMTGRGPMPLRAYASGGVASSPQLAMFGEGSMPEAFVPLPDGRSIPVTMQGARGDVNVQVVVQSDGQVRSTGGDDGMRSLGERIGAVARQVIVDEQRPGGLLYAGAR